MSQTYVSDDCLLSGTGWHWQVLAGGAGSYLHFPCQQAAQRIVREP